MRTPRETTHVGIYVGPPFKKYQRYFFFSGNDKNLAKRITHGDEALTLHARVEIPRRYLDTFTRQDCAADSPEPFGKITYLVNNGIAASVAYFPKKGLATGPSQNGGLAVFLERPAVEHLETQGVTHVKVTHGTDQSRTWMWTRLGLAVGIDEPISDVIQKMKTAENQLNPR